MMLGLSSWAVINRWTYRALGEAEDSAQFTLRIIMKLGDHHYGVNLAPVSGTLYLRG